MLLYLIRHCRTDFNDQRRCQGVTDLPLNDAGARQAEALGERLSKTKFAAIYSSPMRRATQTASVVAGRHGLEVQPEPGLMELNQGVLEGMDMAEMGRAYPDLLKKWVADPENTVMPEGESMRELQIRAWAALEKIAGANGAETVVAAVSHNLAICAVVCKTLRMPISEFRRFRLSPAGFSIIEFEGARQALIALNDTSHLDGIE